MEEASLLLACLFFLKWSKRPFLPLPLVHFVVSETQTAACKAQTANGREGEKELLAKHKKKSDEEKQERGKVGKRKLT